MIFANFEKIEMFRTMRSDFFRKLFNSTFIAFLIIPMLGIHHSPSMVVADSERISSNWMVRQRGQFGGSVSTIATHGNYAYVGQGSRLVIVDISNPAYPVMVGKSDLFNSLVGPVVVNAGYLYIGAETKTYISESLLYKTPGTQHDIVVNGDLIYVNDGENGLIILEVISRSASQVFLPLIKR